MRYTNPRTHSLKEKTLQQNAVDDQKLVSRWRYKSASH